MADVATPMNLVLPREYPFILLSCVILCIECFMVGMIVVGGARFKYFTKEFMAQFKEEHKKAFGEGKEPAVGGHPDCGDGRYARKLPYGDWVNFNNAMRIHHNFVESLPTIITLLLASGLFLP